MNIIKTNFSYEKPLIQLDINKVNYIVLHHPEAITASPEEIHQWHKNQGWSGFGYNEYTRKDGTVYIGRGDYIGAQCQGYNSIGYGICCEGNYDKELIMPEVQKKALVERISINRARFPNYKATVQHNLLYSTKCPGKNFPLAEILKRIEVINLTIDEALKIQVEEGVINSPDYWKKVIDTTINFDQYVINVSKKILEFKQKQG